MRRLTLTLLSLSLAVVAASPALAKSRIKDIVAFEGVRENQLVGQGLVMGLNGTGDNLRNCPMTQQMYQAMTERQGNNTRDANLNTKNVAHVQVTANLPAFAAPGTPIDITVSTDCDAKSLLGGTLVVTALQGADGQTYAVAQGSVQTGAIAVSGASGSSVTKGVPTSGRISGGATVEKEVGFSLAGMKTQRLTLRNPDTTTALRIAGAINAVYRGSASADNPTIVTLTPPPGSTMMAFNAAIENLEVEPDTSARVVIDEVGGTVVMGDAVRISKVAIAQGNLTVSVQESPAVSQPNAFTTGGTTQTVPQTTVSVEEEKGKKLVTLQAGASLGDVVDGLNALGVTPRDLMIILQAIKANGALQADIVVM
ncbi:MAG: flagellar P-ring protein [Caulobacteraceae bacterium]|nr:flagellar P-ring protein [Caulobacteraceae bacterium]